MEFPRHILVRAPNFLGDHVMAFPFYEGISRLYPKARLSLLGPEFVRRLPDTVSFVPLVKDMAIRRSFGGLRGLASELRSERFDLAVGLPASFSSALLFWLANIPQRVAFAELTATPFLTSAIRWRGRTAKRHKSDLYLDLIRELGGEAFPAANPPLARFGTKDRIVVAPGASLALREWPYFLELIVWLRKRFPECRVTVVGAKGEAPWHQRIARLGDLGVDDEVERTSLDQLVEIFCEARLVISNDSGPAHVAASVAGAPTIVLFGPGDPEYIAPAGKNVFHLRREDLACSPCESAVCRAVEKKACLNGLSLERVKADVESAFRATLSLTP